MRNLDIRPGEELIASKGKTDCLSLVEKDNRRIEEREQFPALFVPFSGS